MADDTESDGLHAVEKHAGAVILGAEFRPTDVLELDLAVATGGDNQFVERIDVGQFALSADGEFAGERLDPAAGNVDVLLAQRGLDIVGC